MKDKLGNEMTLFAWEILNAKGTPVTTYNQVNNKAMSEITVWTFSRESTLLEAWFEIRHGARGVNLDVSAWTITHRREVSMKYYYKEIVLGGEEE
jgi:hypothetical protein